MGDNSDLCTGATADGPSARSAAAPAPFALPRAGPLSAKAEPLPVEFYSISSGNTARTRTGDFAVTGQRSPGRAPPSPGPAERRDESRPASAPLPAPLSRAIPPCIPAAPPGLSLPPSPPPGGGRARPPGARGRCRRGGWRRGGCAEGRGRRLRARGQPALTMSAGRVRGAVERRRLPVRPCRFDAAARPLPPPPGSEHPGQRRRPRPRAAPRQSARGSPAIAKYGCATAGREGGAERTTPPA